MDGWMDLLLCCYFSFIYSRWKKDISKLALSVVPPSPLHLLPYITAASLLSASPNWDCTDISLIRPHCEAYFSHLLKTNCELLMLALFGPGNSTCVKCVPCVSNTIIARKFERLHSKHKLQHGHQAATRRSCHKSVDFFMKRGASVLTPGLNSVAGLRNITSSLNWVTVPC